jgi:hypothetical protein
MENTEENCEMRWKIWKKSNLNSEKIGKIGKKGKLSGEMIGKIWNKSKLYSPHKELCPLLQGYPFRCRVIPLTVGHNVNLNKLHFSSVFSISFHYSTK